MAELPSTPTTQAKKCQAIKKDGQPCQSYADASGWCQWHRPGEEAEKKRKEARIRGGQRRQKQLQGRQETARLTLSDIIGNEEAGVRLDTVQDARQLLARICEWVLTERIDPKVCNAAVLAINAALRGISQDVDEQLAELRQKVDAIGGLRSVA